MRKHSISLLVLLLWLLPAAVAQAEVVDHTLVVRLQPAMGTLEVQDKIRLSQPTDAFDFILHAALEPEIIGNAASLEYRDEYRGQVPGKIYRVRFHRPAEHLELRYKGRIQHPLHSDDAGSAGRRPQGTPGIISQQGVFLSGSSLWYPLIPQAMVRFNMRVEIPDGWRTISQGESLADERGWRETAPQDEIYLIAGRYQLYTGSGTAVEAQVYLRMKEEKLAQRYLRATTHYINLYGQLLGPYPYSKFALVENFWESGYGMPSFTLLGPRVLRFPFILHSSYPHEILHNWWGNGVYVDYATGNWSEGLTTYLADHLLQEQQGKGRSYRRDTLQRYADFVHDANDFPLSGFRGRHGDSSQAVGYGKTMMFFHMLRRQLGDRMFVDGLRRFYQDHLYKRAGFADLQTAFEAVSGKNLDRMFQQWTQRTGAPALQLSELGTSKTESGYRLTGVLNQTQSEAPFQLSVPLIVQLENGGFNETLIRMNRRREHFSVEMAEQPVRLSVDPRFDLFRRLATGETPSSFNQLFGAHKMTIVLPAAGPQVYRDALQQLAAAWSKRWPDLETTWDNRLERLPDTGSVWILGINNRFAPSVLQLAGREVTQRADGGVTVAGTRLESDRHSFALTAPRPRMEGAVIGLLHLAETGASGGMARKLPHYGKYSYTAFKGIQPTNILKGQWLGGRSALTVDLASGHQPAPRPIPGRGALTDLITQ